MLISMLIGVILLIPRTISAEDINYNSTQNSTRTMNSASVTINDSGVVIVHDATEYWSAISNQAVSKIVLANDILAPESARVGDGRIGRNLTIDGDGHNLSYVMSSYDPPVLYTSANGITINIQNISIGSVSNPGNTWYGIVRVINSNVVMNIKNVNYYATYGAQPFYADGNSGTILNFEGINSFKLGNGLANYGGEFVERFQTVNFRVGSATTVDQNTSDAEAVFWGIYGTNINVERNANLKIRSNKIYLLYNNPTLNIQDNAIVTYESYKGVSYTSSKLSTGNSVINAGPNSDLKLISNDYPIILSGTTINADSVKSIYAVKNKNFSAISDVLRINRTDSGQFPYTLQTLSATGIQSTGKDNILANTSFTLDASTGINDKSWLYTTLPTINSTAFNSQVGSKLSNLTGSIVGSPNTIRNVKVSTTKLYSGTDITTKVSQNEIDTAAVPSQRLFNDDTTIIGSNLKGNQTQYIYYNIQDATDYLGFFLKSHWVEVQKVQPPYQEITAPDNAITFNKAGMGLFNSISTYRLSNSGNVSVNIGVTSVTDNNSNVRLISTGMNFNSGKQEVSLKLNGATSVAKTSWDFKNPETTRIQVDPYYTTNNTANLNISGNYSGPMIGQLPVSYKINFNISQIN